MSMIQKAWSDDEIDFFSCEALYPVDKWIQLRRANLIFDQLIMS